MVQRYNILGRHTNQYPCLCSHAWSVEVCHGKIRMRRNFNSQALQKTTYKVLSIGDYVDKPFDVSKMLK